MLLRLRRTRVWGGVALVALAMAGLVAVVVRPEEEPAPSDPRAPRGGSEATTIQSDSPAPVDLAAAVTRAVDPTAPAEERVQALRLASQQAPDAGWTRAALEGLRVDDPFAPQVRAMVLSALERYPTDPAARSAALAAAGPDRPREERLVALSVMGAMRRRSPDPGWARAALEALTADPDPQVRASAGAALDGGS